MQFECHPNLICFLVVGNKTGLFARMRKISQDHTFSAQLFTCILCLWCQANLLVSSRGVFLQFNSLSHTTKPKNVAPSPFPDVAMFQSERMTQACEDPEKVGDDSGELKWEPFTLTIFDDETSTLFALCCLTLMAKCWSFERPIWLLPHKPRNSVCSTIQVWKLWLLLWLSLETCCGQSWSTTTLSHESTWTTARKNRACMPASGRGPPTALLLPLVDGWTDRQTKCLTPMVQWVQLTHKHKCTHRNTHKCTHTHTNKHTHVCTNACMHARTHACTPQCHTTCTRKHTLTNRHTHTHSHTLTLTNWTYVSLR